MASGDVDWDAYLPRCLDAVESSDFGRGLDRGSAAIFVWLALNGGGTFERLNEGISSVLGIGSGAINEGLIILRAADLVRLTTGSDTSGGHVPAAAEWILTPAGERAALVVRSAGRVSGVSARPDDEQDGALVDNSQMEDIEERARAIIDENLEWYHSIELAPGIVTPGRSPLEHWMHSLSTMRLPDLTGASVLDIGAYDGFFSFAAERGGATRVVALDHYVWSTDMVGYMADWRESQRSRTPLPAHHESRHWHPDTLPGRRPFDAAHALFDSKVEPVVGDFMRMDLTSLGQFDVVLFLGVLYHLQDPLGAMRRVRDVTTPGGLAVIQTEAMEIVGLEETGLWRFFPDSELNNDPTNWWVPNARALEGLCHAAGFDEVTILTQPPEPPEPTHPAPTKVARLKGSLRQLFADIGIGQGRDDMAMAEAPASPVHYRLVAHAR